MIDWPSTTNYLLSFSDVLFGLKNVWSCIYTGPAIGPTRVNNRINYTNTITNTITNTHHYRHHYQHYLQHHYQYHPSKHKTFLYHLCNVGPTLETLGRRSINAIKMFCVCWEMYNRLGYISGNYTNNHNRVLLTMLSMTLTSSTGSTVWSTIWLVSTRALLSGLLSDSSEKCTCFFADFLLLWNTPLNSSALSCSWGSTLGERSFLFRRREARDCKLAKLARRWKNRMCDYYYLITVSNANHY